MADEDENLEEQVEKKPKTAILLVVAILVTVLLTAVLMFFFLDGGEKAPKEGAETEEVIEEGPKPDPLFFSEKPLMVAFDGEGHARMLAIEVNFLTRDPEVITALEEVNPLIVDHLTFLLREQKYSDMITTEGVNALRVEIKRLADKILKERTFNEDIEVEDVFFTRFVMQ